VAGGDGQCQRAESDDGDCPVGPHAYLTAADSF
jgi:hypothetical protein